jgi:hypothetical protein
MHNAKFIWELLHRFPNCLSLERAIDNSARMVIAVAEHPCFADKPVARKGRG